MARCDLTDAEWTVIKPVPPTAIRIARKLEALYVIDVPSDLFSLRGVARSYPLGQRAGVRCRDRSGLDRTG